MIPYEELAAALAGGKTAARPVPSNIPQHTVLDQRAARPPQNTVMDQPPVLAPPPMMEDSTLNGLDVSTGEVDIGDVLSDEDI